MFTTKDHKAHIRALIDLELFLLLNTLCFICSTYIHSESLADMFYDFLAMHAVIKNNHLIRSKLHKMSRIFIEMQDSCWPFSQTYFRSMSVRPNMKAYYIIFSDK